MAKIDRSIPTGQGEDVTAGRQKGDRRTSGRKIGSVGPGERFARMHLSAQGQSVWQMDWDP